MKIESFNVNHDKLKPGIYVSRKDQLQHGDYVTTFDIRMKKPNAEPVLHPSDIHSLEHLLAQFFRNNEETKNRTIYIGPMGCRTGFYFIFQGNLKSTDIFEWVKKAFAYVIHFKGPLPGKEKKECGNYLDHNLEMAKYEAKKFYDEILLNMQDFNFTYPTD